MYLDKIAIGVILKLSASIAYAIPGASLSITFFVASGVTSRLEKPVPPVVKMTFTPTLSDHLTNVSCRIFFIIRIMYFINK